MDVRVNSSIFICWRVDLTSIIHQMRTRQIEIANGETMPANKVTWCCFCDKIFIPCRLNLSTHHGLPMCKMREKLVKFRLVCLQFFFSASVGIEKSFYADNTHWQCQYDLAETWHKWFYIFHSTQQHLKVKATFMEVHMLYCYATHILLLMRKCCPILQISITAWLLAWWLLFFFSFRCIW